MPYCSHCGSSIGTNDRFCAHCGRSQTAAETAPPSTPPENREANSAWTAPPAPVGGTTQTGPQARPNVAAMICYIPVVGWLASIFFLIADDYRRNRYVHFHALQALYLWMAYWVVRVCFGFTSNLFFEPWTIHLSRSPLVSLVRLAVIVIQIVGMVKVIKGEDYHLPVIGDLAARSMV
jgi:uncharacterized membrane protein